MFDHYIYLAWLIEVIGIDEMRTVDCRRLRLIKRLIFRHEFHSAQTEYATAMFSKYLYNFVIDETNTPVQRTGISFLMLRVLKEARW